MRQYKKQILIFSKNLRQHLIMQEQKLWYYLRAGRFNRIKFKRQVPIGSYIVDFYCAEKKLAIEVDGGQHADQVVINYDYERSKFIESIGITVIRFWNTDVDNNIEGVLEEIRKVTTSPVPLRGTSSPFKGRK